MNGKKWLSMTAAGAIVAALGAVAGVAQAQTPAAAAAASQECLRTRAEVRNECIAFRKTHEWSEQAGDWVLKSTGKPAAKVPEGVTPRAKIRAERDAFLRANKWNEQTGTWEPLGAKTREVSKLSRADVQKETAAFMKTHYWDEALEAYVLKGK
ncbi:MAG: hypothetical protein KIT17_21685 [Rubrivivax sp.]|nr:hypothetical protein [Rubrivivax sp.]